MIIPRSIILWCAVLLPLSAAAFHGDGFAQALIVATGSLFVIAIIDAIMALQRGRQISFSLPELSRFSIKRNGNLVFSISNPAKITADLLFVPLVPDELGALESEFSMRLSADENMKFNCPCLPGRRGSHKVSLSWFEVVSPLGLWSARMKNPLDSEIRVYPDTHSERNNLAAMFLNKSYGGLHLHRVVGQGREFEKLRDYIPGDSFDIVSWKATAKRGKPVCKEYQVERTQEIYAIIDTSRFSGRSKGGISNLDHHFASALVLGQVAEKQGDLFGIITFDDQVKTFIRAGGGKGRYSACRDAVYGLAPQAKSPDFGALFSFVRANLRRRALLVFLTDLDERSLAESFVENISLVSRHHLCMVNMLKDETLGPLFESPADTPDDIYAHLAGHIKWADLLETKRAMARYGVHFSMIDREKLSVNLISGYMDMKRRQMI